jgi:hypothetical protein
VLLQLIAQDEQSAWSQDAVNLSKLLGGLVPEVDDMGRQHEVDRRKLLE